MELRKLQEIEFHNKLRHVDGDTHVADTRWSPAMEETIRNNALWANMKYYSIERESRKMVLDWFQQHAPGKAVLDYCCGNGDDSIQLARAGASSVIGIDLSDVSIHNCRKLAQQEGLASQITFEVRDAEETKFPDNSFDLISEYGSLHHLELDRAFAELARILRPEGKIICNEVLGHNPIIQLYRRVTPRLRTPWEVDHILKKKDFALAKKYFNKVEPRFFHLATLLAVPFRRSRLFEPVLSALEAIDGTLLKLPFFRWQAWQVVFVLSDPKK